MNSKPNEAAIDEIVASCNGDIRGALKALLLVNEQLEAELQQLQAASRRAPAERSTTVLQGPALAGLRSSGKLRDNEKRPSPLRMI